ncbi:hypothetical protein B1R94_13220 [Mycolicibacterium litorale]|nr:hypothetical protein B1R94_13220 [Mycolicibacterium litorale]
MTDNELQVTDSTPRRVSAPPRPDGWHSGVMTQNRRTRSRSLRHPLSLGFEAHRGLLLLRLRWHERAARRAVSSDSDSVD